MEEDRGSNPGVNCRTGSLEIVVIEELGGNRSELPHRQLRKMRRHSRCLRSGELPHRQLRNTWRTASSTA